MPAHGQLRRHIVVVVTPNRQRLPFDPRAVEHLLVQTFVPQPSVEAFDEAMRLSKAFRPPTQLPLGRSGSAPRVANCSFWRQIEHGLQGSCAMRSWPCAERLRGCRTEALGGAVSGRFSDENALHMNHVRSG
jgi:hypothetical protein